MGDMVRADSLLQANAIAKVYPHLAQHLPEAPKRSLGRPRFQLPRKLMPLFRPMRYKVLHGGRGGTKSWGVAKVLLLMAARKKLRILCARELQVSIADSVHKLLCDQIGSDPWLSSRYDTTKNSITCTVTGSEFLFAGIRNNVTKIKSMEGINIVWVEEAEKVSDNSWQVLIPTIRRNGSEIWVTFNPDLKTDPTSKRFLENPPPNAWVQKMGWEDNPWLPQELIDEKDYLYRVDPEAAAHVWGGGYRTNSAAQVLRGKYRIDLFTPEPDWDGPYYGSDFGFSVDPSTLVKLFIHKNKLYLYEEAYGHGVEVDEMPTFYEGGTYKKQDGTERKFQGVTGCKKRPIRADSARPETISYLQRHGFGNVIGAKKWPGSVEDGVAFLRGFEEIIIHPRCTYAIQEAQLWSYKVDRLTKEPTTDLDDKHNHIWDAVRYALEPVLLQRNTGMLNYLKELSSKPK